MNGFEQVSHVNDPFLNPLSVHKENRNDADCNYMDLFYKGLNWGTSHG
jgi:hypothetical protein